MLEVTAKQSPQVDLELGLHEPHWWHDEESNMWTRQLDPKSLQCAPLEREQKTSSWRKTCTALKVLLLAWADKRSCSNIIHKGIGLVSVVRDSGQWNEIFKKKLIVEVSSWEKYLYKIKIFLHTKSVKNCTVNTVFIQPGTTFTTNVGQNKQPERQSWDHRTPPCSYACCFESKAWRWWHFYQHRPLFCTVVAG